MRLPDAVLESLGSPPALQAVRRGDEVVLTPVHEGAPTASHCTADPAAWPGRASSPSYARSSKRFPTAARPVLDEVSRALRERDVHRASSGRSGSGKTTLLHLLAGLDLPTAGEVVVQERELTGMSRVGASPPCGASTSRS